jgi:hypothetical protein
MADGHWIRAGPPLITCGARTLPERQASRWNHYMNVCAGEVSVAVPLCASVQPFGGDDLASASYHQAGMHRRRHPAGPSRILHS